MTKINPFIRQLLVVVLLCTGFEAFSQFGQSQSNFRDNRMDRSNNRMNNMRGMAPDRRIQAYKEGYMNLKLQMTAEQSQRFWPVYRQYEHDIKEVRRAKRFNNSNNQPNGREQLDKELYYDQRLVEIRKHYNDEFLKILPPQKVSLIYKSEREFTDELIRQLGERPDATGNGSN